MTTSSILQAVATAKASVVGVRAGEKYGSGFVATQNGLICTNLHVVGYGGQAAIRYGTAPDEVPAKVIWADTRLDIALLVPAHDPPVPGLMTASLGQAAVGAQVIAIGNPLGFEFSVTSGVVSALDRKVSGVPYVQHDAPVNGGNSGGPLVDETGAVVGVNTWGIEGGLGLNFAVPMRLLEPVLSQLAAPREQLVHLVPRYHCTECSDPFQPDHSHRCQRCGAALPRFSISERSIATMTLARGEEVVTGLLEGLGFQSKQVRHDEGVWRLEQPGGEVWVEVDDGDRFVSFTARLVRTPDAGHEAFFRFLLTANDRSLEHCKLSLMRRIVVLSFVERLDFLDVNEVSARLTTLIELSQSLRSTLIGSFGATAAPTRLEEAAHGLD